MSLPGSPKEMFCGQILVFSGGEVVRVVQELVELRVKGLQVSDTWWFPSRWYMVVRM